MFFASAPICQWDRHLHFFACLGNDPRTLEEAATGSCAQMDFICGLQRSLCILIASQTAHRQQPFANTVEYPSLIYTSSNNITLRCFRYYQLDHTFIHRFKNCKMEVPGTEPTGLVTRRVLTAIFCTLLLSGSLLLITNALIVPPLSVILSAGYELDLLFSVVFTLLG